MYYFFRNWERRKSGNVVYMISGIRGFGQKNVFLRHFAKTLEVNPLLLENFLISAVLVCISTGCL